jgi:hypothetical protein
MKNRYKLPFSFVLLLTTIFVQAQTADEIVAKYFDAIGGKKKLTSIKSVKKTYTTDNEISGSGTLTVVEDVGARVEVKSGLFGTNTNIVNKKKGWSIIQTPFDEKPEIKEMSETDRSLAFPRTYMEVDEHMPWNNLTSILRYGTSKYNTAELIGKETIVGKECFKLKVTSAVDLENWWFDASTGYCVRQQDLRDKEAGPIRFSDYRANADGIMMPYKMEVFGKDGKVLITTTFTDFETNVKVDKDLFTYKAK